MNTNHKDNNQTYIYIDDKSKLVNGVCLNHIEIIYNDVANAGTLMKSESWSFKEAQASECWVLIPHLSLS